MLKPFQIRDLHRSPSSSSPNEAADLDNPLSPTRRRGIVQLSASQYDNLSSSHPRARLTYLDEDDGELITVGSSLELSQRLEEPVDAELDPITAPQSALEPMHIFDIRRSNSVTELWKKFECRQETRETKDMNDARTESTPAEPSASTTHQTAEGSDSPQRDAHAADIEESESLLAAFEAEMAKFLSTSRPATGPTPPAESSSSSQSNSESRSARPQNAAEAFTHAMHSLIDGAELLSSGLMSRLPEIERQLQNAQRAIPENVGASVQGALAAVEAQLRQVTNSLNNSPAVTAQAAHILEGELPTATSTVESLRSMASELGNVGHTLFEAFEAELGCNRTRPHEQSSATSTEHRSSDDLVSDRNPEVTQARSTETSLETTDSTTGLETEKSITKEKNEAKDAELQESSAQPRMSSNLDSSDPISEPSRRQTQSIRFPNVQPPLQPMHHSRRRPHPYPPPAPHPHHHPRAPPFPPFFHHPPPPHWQPPPGVPPSWPFSTLPELRNGYPSAPPPPPPPPPPHFHLDHRPLDLRSHLHRGRHQSQYQVGPTNFSDVPADNVMGPTDVPPAACHARGVRPSEEGTALFIGNVGFDVSEKMITDVFASKGFLVDVHLPQESETGKHAGFGYLQFPTVHAANAALDALQGEHIDGHAINLEFSDHSPILGLRPQKAQSQPESNQPVASATAQTKRPSELQGSVASSARHSADEASVKRAVPLTVADLCSNDNRKPGDVVSSMNGLEIPSDDDADQLNILDPSLLPEGSPQPSRSNSIPSTLSDLTAEAEQRRFPPISQLEAQFRAMQCHQTAPAQSKTPDDGPKSLDTGLTSSSSSSTIPGTFPETSGDAAKPVEIPSSSHHVPDELESQIGPRRHSRRSRSMKHPHSSWKGHGVGSGQVEPGPSHNFLGRPRSGFSHRARHHREPERSSSQPQLTPTMRQTSIDACVATLVDLGYGGASDGGLQRIAVYAAAADANVLDAIDMIEEERKAYEQQGSFM